MCAKVSSFLWKIIANKPNELDEDATRTPQQLIESRGFECEVHDVTTSDGYVLTLHRIVHPSPPENGHSQPVLLMHGYGSSPGVWVCNAGGYLTTNSTGDRHGKDTNSNETTNGQGDQYENNLGFCLAKKGHDVWLGVLRGHKSGRKHITLSIEEGEYWDYTIDDMVANDLPATMEFILKSTKSKNIAYVGMSLGTTIMFGLLSTRPEYNDIVKPFVAMGPSWTMNNMKSPVKLMQRFLDPIYRWTPWLKPFMGEGAEKNIVNLTNGHIFAKPFAYVTFMFAGLLSGYDSRQTEWERIGVTIAHHSYLFPPKQTLHNGQFNIVDRPFSKFDHGKEKNIQIYGTATPPIYDIGKITNKFMVFMYGNNDWCATREDVRKTIAALKVPLFDDYLVPDNNWTHFDFQSAKEVGRLVYSRIADYMERVYPEEDPKEDPNDFVSMSSSPDGDFSFIDKDEVEDTHL